MGTQQVQQDNLCRQARQLRESCFGPAVRCLTISGTFSELEEAPWEINILVPSGEVHGFSGSDSENAVHNLERFGVGVIRRGLLHQPADFQSA